MADRTRYWFDLGRTAEVDNDGLTIEDFDMAENLMLEGACEDFRHPVLDDFEGLRRSRGASAEEERVRPGAGSGPLPSPKRNR